MAETTGTTEKASIEWGGNACKECGVLLTQDNRVDPRRMLCKPCRNRRARGRYVRKGPPERSGPLPKKPRGGDKIQARQRVNVEVRTGRRAHPNTLPCADCGHIYSSGERRHEYDHHLGYSAEHHYDVEPVCTICHAARDSSRKRQVDCKNGHPFTSENTIIATNGTRHCRECRRAYDRSRQRDAAFWREYRRKRNGR